MNIYQIVVDDSEPFIALIWKETDNVSALQVKQYLDRDLKIRSQQLDNLFGQIREMLGVSNVTNT